MCVEVLRCPCLPSRTGLCIHGQCGEAANEPGEVVEYFAGTSFATAPRFLAAKCPGRPRHTYLEEGVHCVDDKLPTDWVLYTECARTPDLVLGAVITNEVHVEYLDSGVSNQNCNRIARRRSLVQKLP